MKRSLQFTLIICALCVLARPGFPAQDASPVIAAAAILEKIDQNAVPGSKIMVAAMTIHGRRADRTIKSKSWIEGDDKAFTEYLDPPREKGIKMLKLGDQLWTYTPATDRIIGISGNLLRQSVMGSDLSYEDMMENRKWSDIYEAVEDGEETMLARPCLILRLTARVENVAYHQRRIWVDKDRWLVLKEERYGKSGRLLKTFEVTDVRQFEGRWIQTRALFRDVLKEGNGTEFVIESVDFDAQIPEVVFSKASLRK
ncbi:MAG: outer membrane lipoprotein-sorting protein [Candidatus Aminicenantes bacterium]|nr:outer membrane lipoprotein-sorting protein [Candidatus Aminicenantes bacterium]